MGLSRLMTSDMRCLGEASSHGQKKGHISLISLMCLAIPPSITPSLIWKALRWVLEFCISAWKRTAGNSPHCPRAYPLRDLDLAFDLRLMPLRDWTTKAISVVLASGSLEPQLVSFLTGGPCLRWPGVTRQPATFDSVDKFLDAWTWFSLLQNYRAR